MFLNVLKCSIYSNSILTISLILSLILSLSLSPRLHLCLGSLDRCAIPVALYITLTYLLTHLQMGYSWAMLPSAQRGILLAGAMAALQHLVQRDGVDGHDGRGVQTLCDSVRMLSVDWGRVRASYTHAVTYLLIY